MGQPSPGEMIMMTKPVLINTGPVRIMSDAGRTVDGGGLGVYSSGLTKFSLKETWPQLRGESLKKDKTSSTYDLVE